MGYPVHEQSHSKQLCVVLKIVMEEGERYGRPAQTPHVEAGTKMTPVAERWPEPNFVHCRVSSPWLLVPLGPFRDCAFKSPNESQRMRVVWRHAGQEHSTRTPMRK